MENIYPWFRDIWQKLILYKRNSLLPSGILFSGPAGIGKRAFITEFSKFLLCQGQEEVACLTCRSCILFQAGTHPDFFFIHPEEKTTVIKVEQIRNLTHSLVQTSILNGIQLALISLAEEMNKAASNALLKTLEEPQGKVVIILLSNQPALVPATILSRCQQIKLPLKNQLVKQWLTSKVGAQAETLLAMADNLPIKAIQLATKENLHMRERLITYLQQVRKGVLDPTQAASECLTFPIEQLQFLMTIILDMIRIKLSAQEFVSHPDKLVPLTELCCNVSHLKLFQFLDVVLEAIKVLGMRNNANLQLLMEKIFINWRYDNDVS